MNTRQAIHDDGQFILESIVKSAHKHFNSEFRKITIQNSLVEQISSTISRGFCPMPQGNYQSRIQVSEIGGKPTGFLWLLQKSKHETELYILFVAPEHRRKGHAEILIKEALSALTLGAVVTSRVMWRSKEMKHLLKKLSFEGRCNFLLKPQRFIRIIS